MLHKWEDYQMIYWGRGTIPCGLDRLPLSKRESPESGIQKKISVYTTTIIAIIITMPK